MKTSVLETDCIAMLGTALKRSPDQLHGAHERDAELIRLHFVFATVSQLGSLPGCH